MVFLHITPADASALVPSMIALVGVGIGIGLAVAHGAISKRKQSR
jgi:hypothetical protein